jgi:hypothetical protein
MLLTGIHTPIALIYISHGYIAYPTDYKYDSLEQEQATISNDFLFILNIFTFKLSLSLNSVIYITHCNIISKFLDYV